jgi:hypothetical protein
MKTSLRLMILLHFYLYVQIGFFEAKIELSFRSLPKSWTSLSTYNFCQTQWHSVDGAAEHSEISHFASRSDHVEGSDGSEPFQERAEVG